MIHAVGDSDRPNELVTGTGQRWFGWGYHMTILRERSVEGVREVLVVRDESPGKPGPTKKAHWIAAWRIQKFCTRSGGTE